MPTPDRGGLVPYLGAPPAPRLLVITPCHNDGWALEGLAASLLDQRLRPARWIVVDDASTDDTPAVLDRLRASVPFLVALRREREAGRRIGEKALAVMAAYEAGRHVGPDYVAVVDADVVLPPHYFSSVHSALVADAGLGVTGGLYAEIADRNGRSPGGPAGGRARGAGGRGRVRGAGGGHVPGPAQVFRAEVFAAVGGYAPLPYGGDDVESVTRARMLGWRTGPRPDLHYVHRRRMGTGGHGSALRADRNLGRQDYDLGVAAAFEAVKVARHLARRPVLLSGAMRALGYLELVLRRAPRHVDDAYVAFVRREQRDRLTRRAQGR